jgi:hypothetical protein
MAADTSFTRPTRNCDCILADGKQGTILAISDLQGCLAYLVQPATGPTRLALASEIDTLPLTGVIGTIGQWADSYLYSIRGRYTYCE